MVKSKVINYIVCDGCRHEVKDEDLCVVTFTTPTGERSYDICKKCVKDFEDILTREEKAEPEKPKTIKDLKVTDLPSPENHRQYVKIEPERKKVEAIGEDAVMFTNRCGRVLKRLLDKKMVTKKCLITEAGLSSASLYRLLDGECQRLREDTILRLKKWFKEHPEMEVSSI